MSDNFLFWINVIQLQFWKCLTSERSSRLGVWVQTETVLSLVQKAMSCTKGLLQQHEEINLFYDNLNLEHWNRELLLKEWNDNCNNIWKVSRVSQTYSKDCELVMVKSFDLVEKICIIRVGLTSLPTKIAIQHKKEKEKYF